MNKNFVHKAHFERAGKTFCNVYIDKFALNNINRYTRIIEIIPTVTSDLKLPSKQVHTQSQQ